jgi:predicted AlkP superfamily pyrophosphatase or phosphodiesterase
LLSAELDPIVDLVAWSPEPNVYEVASADGHQRIQRVGTSEFASETLSGAAPVDRQDPTHFGSLAGEMADPHPHRSRNSYPHAYEHLAQVFDHPSAPDLVVIHTGSHYWGDQGGHLGEHGSPGVLQARAPFIASGAGVATRGVVDGSCQLVDVAPTVLALLGLSDTAGQGDLLPRDGRIVPGIIESSGAATHVVAFLLDGTNPNVMLDLMGRGLLPNLSRLLDAGTALRHGAIASVPTVTLANHTGILTGRHPGHHGVLHNAWVDRSTGEQVITNSPLTWVDSMKWLHPGADTLHQAVHRARKGSTTISINEPCDVGADFSVFDLMRRGESVERAPRPDELPDATERFVRPSKDYRWSSQIDHTAVDQFTGIWSGEYRGQRWDLPAFSWVNFTLTDAAFHEGGPYSEMAAASLDDTDARIGKILDVVERAGVYDETTFVVVADHGMQLADPAVTGDWDEALRTAGVPVRDEGYGFLYLTT